ncbi:response regulator transcription factor [Treponema phagedenis]|uniref:response regulator transcription factor n=1 Tax=Treponema phagedenis TaxID=162 RepID=UPI0001F64124|nr:LuxR C-terminal-related transcriptional regulator [Treponema phagedenis]EFW37715.1 transcriptional regulator, LuxR family [Treponema phagedenis F0421]TYT78906.1 response regulator transcription factor [Treponema phagedenis]
MLAFRILYRFNDKILKRLISTLLIICLVLLSVFLLSARLRQKKNQKLQKEFSFLLYQLNEIESYSFQVLANKALNRTFEEYINSDEVYQVSKWNTEFSTFTEGIIQKNPFVRDVIFFPLNDVKKKALTVREDLSFNEIQIMRTPFVRDKAKDLNGRFFWYTADNHLAGLRLIKNYRSNLPIGILCFYVNTEYILNLSEKLKYMSKVLILDVNTRAILFPSDLSDEKPLPAKLSGWYKGFSYHTVFSVSDSKEQNNALAIVSIDRPIIGFILYSHVSLYLFLFLLGVLILLYYLQRKQRQEKLQAQERELFFDCLKNFNLSKREYIILELICQGSTGKEIAYKLNLKEQTIKNYTSRLYKKLGVTGRVEACQRINSLIMEAKKTVKY